MLVFPALVPIFVIALTLAAFANGFVMMLQVRPSVSSP